MGSPRGKVSGQEKGRSQGISFLSLSAWSCVFGSGYISMLGPAPVRHPFLHVLSSYLETLALLIPSPLFVSLALGMLVTLFVVADF